MVVVSSKSPIPGYNGIIYVNRDDIHHDYRRDLCTKWYCNIPDPLSGEKVSASFDLSHNVHKMPDGWNKYGEDWIISPSYIKVKTASASQDFVLSNLISVAHNMLISFNKWFELRTELKKHYAQQNKE